MSHIKPVLALALSVVKLGALHADKLIIRAKNIAVLTPLDVVPDFCVVGLWARFAFCLAVLRATHP
jgi:hypothetical protein